MRPVAQLSRFASRLVGSIAVLALAACGDSSPTDPRSSEPSENESPTASIVSPAANSTFTEDDTVVFEGEASDPEDGALSNSSVTWESNQDGRLGTGASVEVVGLSRGDHTVTLTATDSEGATSSDEISVTVEVSNRSPNVSIETPSDSSVFAEGDTVLLEGSATDPEEGALSGSSLVWESNSDGELGTGEAVEVSSLSVGDHTVTLTATDPEGAKTSDEVSITVEAPPTVSLGVKLPRPDLNFADSATIANGEAVMLAWSSTNDPTDCQASGNWSGDESVSGDTVRTAGLSGSANLEYILRCENSAGVDADTVYVDVGAPGQRHATSNRPDVSDKQKVRFFYVIPEGGQDRELDLGGGIESVFKAFQDTFEIHTGRRFRVDTYNDGYDITFVEAPINSDDNQSDRDEIRWELQDRGLYNRDEYFLVIFYDGENTGPSGGCCREAYINHLLSNEQRPKDPSTVGHELVHAHNIVDEDAPNEGPEDNPGHVTDHEDDLMDETSGEPFTDHFLVDYGCDDYYWDPGLARCADVPEPADDINLLSDSPVLIVQ